MLVLPLISNSSYSLGSKMLNIGSTSHFDIYMALLALYHDIMHSYPYRMIVHKVNREVTKISFYISVQSHTT